MMKPMKTASKQLIGYTHQRRSTSRECTTKSR